MSMDIADSAAGAAAATRTAEAAAPDPASTPLLRTLGDADAAVCTDGFCAEPAAEAATQPEAATQTGADK
jgi:hypothetical protein